jgi:hypothetical protein
MHSFAHWISHWWTLSNTPDISEIPAKQFSILSQSFPWSVLLGLGENILYMSPQKEIYGIFVR